MFGIGLWELVLIFAVALLVVGPEQLPVFAKKLAKIMQDFFDLHNIPYLMFNAFDNEKVIPNSTSKFKDMIDT